MSDQKNPSPASPESGPNSSSGVESGPNINGGEVGLVLGLTFISVAAASATLIILINAITRPSVIRGISTYVPVTKSASEKA